MSGVSDASGTGHATTNATVPPSSKGWRVERVDGSEVFISPAGDWYARCQGSEVPDVEIPSKHKGIRPLKLREINHLRPDDRGVSK